MCSEAPSETLHQPHEGILTATRGVHAPPEIHSGSRASHRRFVFLLLCASAFVVACVAGLNAAVNPYGSLGENEQPSAIWSDRAVKVDLVNALTTPPQTVVLGSSRALKVEPAYITRLSGRPAFNAAVSAGKPVDAYVFVRLLHDRFPTTPQTYLWLLDQESFAPEPMSPVLVNNATLSSYLPKKERFEARLTDLSWLLSWRTLKTSWRTWQHQRTERKAVSQRQTQTSAKGSKQRTSRIEFLPDGLRVFDVNDLRAKRGVPLRDGIAASTEIFAKRYRTDFPGLAQMQKTWFERTLRQMNDWGSTPVIVLSPVHPRLLAALRPLGWDRRHEQVLAYLATLRPHYRFVLLDMSYVSSFGASPRLFFDGVHMKIPNYRRLLRAVYSDTQASAALRGSQVTDRRTR